MSGNLFLLSFLYPDENNLCFSGAWSSWNLVLFDAKNSFSKNNSLKYRLKHFWTFPLATPDPNHPGQRKVSPASRGHINCKDMYYKYILSLYAHTSESVLLVLHRIHSTRSGSEFPDCSTIDILGQIILCCKDCSAQFRMFSSTPGIYLRGASSTPSPSGIVKCPLEGKIVPRGEPLI